MSHGERSCVSAAFGLVLNGIFFFTRAGVEADKDGKVTLTN